MIDWKIDGDGHCFNVLSIKCSAVSVCMAFR